MTKEEKIKQEVEETLAAFDRSQRAEAPAFLFTRLLARMQRPHSAWPRIFKPALAALTVITMIQLFVVIGNRNSAAPDPIDRLMQEYHLEQNNGFNF
ncbi:MAG: hypothetical protein FD123_1302 [Bacteroidetes bacterium]|nr:MAG: hypothetical protein FD123_1302 [Bacteroidota bacterium]